MERSVELATKRTRKFMLRAYKRTLWEESDGGKMKIGVLEDVKRTQWAAYFNGDSSTLGSCA